MGSNSSPCWTILGYIHNTALNINFNFIVSQANKQEMNQKVVVVFG